MNPDSKTKNKPEINILNSTYWFNKCISCGSLDLTYNFNLFSSLNKPIILDRYLVIIYFLISEKYTCIYVFLWSKINMPEKNNRVLFS